MSGDVPTNLGLHTPQRARQRVDSSSSSGQTASSVTGSSPSGAASSSKSPRRRQVRWRGTLSEPALNRLRQEFGQLILCPGRSTSKLHKTDGSGLLVIPSSDKGYEAVRAVFIQWQAHADQQGGWLPTALGDSSIEPIRGEDLLAGLPKGRWREYVATYKRLRALQTTASQQQQGHAAASASSSAQPPI